MNISVLVIISVILFLAELFYFKIADRFNIVDQPNHRSSHSALTIRGGGIIFVIGLLLYPLFYGFEYSYFLLGLTLIGLISFMDDLKPVSNRLRIIVHLGCVALMFYQLGLFNLPLFWLPLALFLVIGSINAINFMDGINGITGSYALVTLCTFLYVNLRITEFTETGFIITSIISVLVFNFFNFRKKAKCFAGDVGSVSMAFIIMFLLLQLIIKTGNFNYLLILLLYGLDTVTTMFFRKMRKENIFDAHRSHFYQYWANERKTPHLLVSFIYALIQILINILIVLCMTQSLLILLTSLVISTIIFIAVRFSTEGRLKLLGHRNIS